MPVDLPEPVSEGHRQLLEIPQSLAAIGAAVGVTQQAVSRWRAGLSTPRARQRGVLRDVYGIPPEAWDERPEADSRPEPAASVRPPPRPLPGGATTLDQVDALIARVRETADADRLAPSALAALAREERQLLALRGRLEARAELLEDRIVREHPAWVRIRRLLVRVVESLPADRARELAAELEALA